MLGRKSARLAAAAVAAALALSACGGGSDSDNGDGTSGGTLALGNIVPPKSLAAADAAWANDAPYIQAVYDSLLRETPDGVIEPWLATEWSYNEDRTVLTMQLRDDVTFTDGEAFNADVAAQNVLRFKAGTAPNASVLALVTDATATDTHTLQITLAQPDPALLHALAQNAGAQASPASFDDPDAQTTPIGSGPYVLDSDATVVGSSYVFTQNPDYWAPDEQHYDTVTITVLSDSQAALNAIQGGQVDVMPLIDATTAPQAEAAGYSTVATANGWGGLLLFDRDGQVAPELADVRVRQAMAHAIDREAMLEAGGGEGSVTGQVFNPNGPAYDESLDDAYPYDPEQARDLLSEAGYPDGFTIPMPLIQIGSTTVFDLVRQYLADVGIEVAYEPVALADVATAVLSGRFPATLFTIGYYSTPWQEAQFLISPAAAFNVFQTTDPEVDALLATMQTGSDDEAAEAARELNEYVVEQAWFVPLTRSAGFVATSPDTQLEPQSDNAYPLLQNIRPAS